MAYPLGKFQFPIGRMTVSYNDTNSFPVRDYSFPVRKPLFPIGETLVSSLRTDCFKPLNKLFEAIKQI